MNQDCVKFIYKNKIYPLDYNLFKKHANYELEEDLDYHYLINEFEGDLKLTDEMIQSFLDFFQNQTVNLTIDNVLIFDYLSSKYQISKLSDLIKQFIQNNTKDILIHILKSQAENEVLIENFISSNFLQLITDDRLLTLSISQLFRIFDKYINKSIKSQNNYNNKKEDKDKEKDLYKKEDKHNEEEEDKHNEEEEDKHNEEEEEEDKEKEEEEDKEYKEKEEEDKEEENKDKEKDLYKEEDKNKEEEEEEDKKKEEDKEEEEDKEYKEKEEEEDKEKEKEKEEEKDDDNEIKIIDFLFGVIQRKGKEATILFSLFEMSKKGRKYLNQKLLSNIKLFDFDFAISNLIARLIDNDEKHQEQEKKFQAKYESLEMQFKRKLQDLEKKFQSKYDLLEKEFQKERIKENKRIEQLNKTIYNINSSEYFQGKNDYETFNKLQSESQLLIILGIYDQNPKNKTIQNISNLLQYLSKEQQKSNYKFNDIKYIEIETEDNKKKLFSNSKNQQINLQPYVFKMFQSNQTIKSKELTNVINNFDEIHTKINYPKDHKILEDIINIKKSTKFNLSIDVILSEIDEKDKTFQFNEYIRSVVIESAVKQIKSSNNRGFFEGCSLLFNVSIPCTVELIGTRSFKGCSSLTQIVIPSSVKLIEEGSFEDCKSLNIIDIQSPITRFSKNMFKGCLSLTQISIPSSVTEIRDYAFSGCLSLTQISIPSSVISFGNNIFKGINKLEMTGDIKYIPSKLFYLCSTLTQISIPLSVTKIGSSAFSGCSSLTAITIPSSVTEIESSAFEGCSSLTQISIPSSVISFGNNIFKGINKLEMTGDIKYIPSKLFYLCSTLTQISIPSSVIKIGSSAFSGCSSLTTITIPSSITKIESSAFEGCSSLTQISIPSSVTEIGSYAFYKCSSLTQISIPSSVTKIGNYAFEGCSSLKNIENKSFVNLNIFTLAFMNKDNQRKASFIKMEKNQTMYDVKLRLLAFFSKSVKNTITEFIMVREGPSKDTLDDTITDNYFDDKYNNETLSNFLKMIEDKQI